MTGRAPLWLLVIVALGVVAGVIFFTPGRDGEDGPPPDSDPATDEFDERMTAARGALAAGRFDDAIRAALEAAAAAPTRAEPFALLGETHAARGDWESAEATFADAADRDVSNPDGWLGLARIRMRRLLTGSFAPVIVVDGDRVAAVLTAGQANDQIDGVTRALERAIYALPAESPGRTYARAVTMFLTGDERAIIPMLADRRDYDSTLLRAHARLAVAEIDDAARDFREAAADVPGDRAFRPGLAAAQWFLGNTDEALATLEPLPHVRGWLLASCGRGDEALAALEGADDAVSQFVAGWVLFRRASHAEAHAALRAAFDAGFEPARWPLAESAMAMGRSDEAVELLSDSFAAYFPEVFQLAARTHLQAALAFSREAESAPTPDEQDRLRDSALMLWARGWAAAYGAHRLSYDAQPRAVWTEEQAERMELDLTTELAAAGSDAGSLTMRAALRYHRRDYEAAERDLIMAQQIMDRGLPPDEEARVGGPFHHYFALTLEARGNRRDEAIRHRNETYRYDPDHRPNGIALGRLEFQTEQLDALASRMTDLLRRFPYEAEFYRWRAWAHEEASRWPDAFDDALMRERLGAADGARDAARYILLAGRTEEDLAFLLDRCRRPDAVRAELSALWTSLAPPADGTDWESEFVEAAAAEQRAATDEERAAARLRVGLALLHLGHPDRAIPYLEQAGQARPSGLAQYALGLAHWQTGDARMAESALWQGTIVDSSYAQLYAPLAVLTGINGNLDQARLWLARLLVHAPYRPFDAHAIPVVPGPREGAARDSISIEELRGLLDR